MLLDWTLMFLVFALIAGLLGFTGIAREGVEIARVLFFIFLIVYIASFFFRRM